MRNGYGAGFAFSLLAIAVGAVLYWGITTTQTHGFRLSTVGIILMVIGGIGVVVSAALYGTSRTPGTRRTLDHQVLDSTGGQTVVHEEVR